MDRLEPDKPREPKVAGGGCSLRRKPFLWRKLTPAQIELMQQIADAADALPYETLEYRHLVVFEEIRKLKLADMRPKGRSKLEVVLTEKGRRLRDDDYQTSQIVVRVTGPQIELLQHLDDGFAYEDSVGRTMQDLPGMMFDVCRRMTIRGWVEWHGGWDGLRWARLTPAGREVLAAVEVFDEAVRGVQQARRDGRLQ